MVRWRNKWQGEFNIKLHLTFQLCSFQQLPWVRILASAFRFLFMCRQERRWGNDSEMKNSKLWEECQLSIIKIILLCIINTTSHSCWQRNNKHQVKIKISLFFFVCYLTRKICSGARLCEIIPKACNQHFLEITAGILHLANFSFHSIIYLYLVEMV